MYNRILLSFLLFCLWCSLLHAQEKRIVYCRDFDWIALRTIEPVTKIKKAFFKLEYNGDTLKSVEIKVNRRKLEVYRKRKKWRGSPILRYHSEFRGHAVYENTFFLGHPWTNAVFYPSVVYHVNKNDSTAYQVGFDSNYFTFDFIRYISQEPSANRISVAELSYLWGIEGIAYGRTVLNDSIRAVGTNLGKIEYCLNLLLKDSFPREPRWENIYIKDRNCVEVSEFGSFNGLLHRTWKRESLQQPYYYLFFIANRVF